MNILIDYVRIHGLRGLENIEVPLEPVTLLTGMNNTGKTSFLKALQIVFGSRQFISPDDFYIDENDKLESITIDIRIIPVDNDCKRTIEFDDKWLEIFGEDRIQTDRDGKALVPLRTIASIDSLNSIKVKQYILQLWTDFKNEDNTQWWYQSANGMEKSFSFEEMPFFYMDAQRDILEDLKQRGSYMGRMLSQIEYSSDDIKKIEDQIEELNEQAVSSSDVLSNIEATLKDLDTALDNGSQGVDITPFPKKVRDLNRGVSIQYSDFSMDYHGMGTRSWSSLLTLKSFIDLSFHGFELNEKPYFPILAVEEPEAHLHPNAQKKLYYQISGFHGQKIISSHSPYVAGCAELSQIRNLYKMDDHVYCGKIKVNDFKTEEIRKIKRQVINTRGEIFFAKAIVLFEGETEEQSLPIFASHFFDISCIELGIDFIGVGGHGNYLPFLRVAESLNIPWYIFSDSENSNERNVKESVQRQYRECGTSRSESDCIIFLDDDNNFEKQIIADGYSDEIKEAIINLTDFANEQHKNAKSQEIREYDDDKLYDVITDSKTQYGPEISEFIIKSGKGLPPKVNELFTRINEDFNLEG